MVGCGFNQSKEFEIILKNPTSLVIGSNQSIILNNLSSFKKPSYTFIYVLTDLWKNDEEVGKEFKFEKNDTILFGRESAGVPESVHQLINDRLKIPMSEDTRSLNIASSVAIILAESLRQTKLI